MYGGLFVAYTCTCSYFSTLRKELVESLCRNDPDIPTVHVCFLEQKGYHTTVVPSYVCVWSLDVYVFTVYMYRYM